MATTRWTQDQTKLAFHLYCQIPYGRIHRVLTLEFSGALWRVRWNDLLGVLVGALGFAVSLDREALNEYYK